MSKPLPPAVAELFDNNHRWADRVNEADPEYFNRLSAQQTPKFLWIGCADSRVPANQVVDLDPGEVFVHRNVANLVIHSDMNCLSVIQYAVEVLKVEHILVCGHYGCGGIAAVMQDQSNGLVDNWVNTIKVLRYQHRESLAKRETFEEKHDRLCELNVIQQVANVANTSVVRDAWARGQALSVSGIIYGLSDGKLKDLEVTITCREDIRPVFEHAIYQSE